MPKHEYESLREGDKAWTKLQRPILIGFIGIICIAIFACTVISLKIVFPGDVLKRPFCDDRRLQPLPLNAKGGGVGDSDLYPGAFYLTDQETVDYYWMVVFIPSMVIFWLRLLILWQVKTDPRILELEYGITVAYSAPTRHGCLKAVENNYCASKRGGVRCLSILNVVFAIIFGLFALFLGSSLLTLGSSCSLPLFWCYEIASWGLVILYGGTAFFLRRRAAVILDEVESGSRTLGLEMLETNPLEVTPDVERRVNEGFKTWMGSSLLSSDEEDDSDSYHEPINHHFGPRSLFFLEKQTHALQLYYAQPSLSPPHRSSSFRRLIRLESRRRDLLPAAMARCSWCCLHYSLKTVNLIMTFLGIAMIVYSLWLQKMWNLGAAQLPSYPSLRKPW
ncbi:eukaryotic translation initiation factor 3 subunit L-like [Hibiscus syriacus]|uniref:Eukaryotic translation initiation factor 3 subunit L-like n=1 Tax=Hibiscus syriacus TaxID=106335 RepID=A0A6A2X5Q3_HIBSY|nr:eukaryotic translation initiation factor 3 subunit L-like [Hibiscus syriacus]